MKKDGKIWLSHTGLENLERCPRCFWLQYNRGIRQPEGIVSRLANRFDNIIKKYFDLYRETKELPPFLEKKIEGSLENPFIEKYFYNYDQKYGFTGKLDDCLITKDGKYSPIDFKTSSSDPREKETLAAYQNQLDSYAFLLEQNKKKSSGVGHLIYFFPDHGKKLHEGMPMIIHIETLKTNPENTMLDIKKAILVLDGPLPKPHKDCPFCAWFDLLSVELEK